MNRNLTQSILIVSLVLFGPGAVSTAVAQTADDATEGRSPREAAFNDRVQPFLKKFCSECHGEETQEKDVALHALDLAKFATQDVELWSQVAEKLTFAEMPPADAPQPSHAERTQLAGWIKTELRATGRKPEWEHTLLYPEYGNLIDHATLFNGSVKAAAYSPSRLWKKSPDIFDSLVQRGIGLGTGRNGQISQHLEKVKQPFTIEDKSGIKDFAAIMAADSATLGTMLRNAEVIVDKHLDGAINELQEKRDGPIPEDQLPKDKKGRPIRPRFAKSADEFRTIIFSESPPTDDQIGAAIRKMFNLMIERDPSSSEEKKYHRLMRECVAIGGNAEGLRTALIAIAISPPSIYRMELGQGPIDEHGRQMLGPANLAFAIAYALTDEKPDSTLLAAAKSGQLGTREDVAREATRLWDDSSIDKPRVLRFFHEFFGYHRASQVFKDDARFGHEYDRNDVAGQLVQDADTLVMHIVGKDKNVLAELLTTEKYFVAHLDDNEQARKTNDALTTFYEYLKDKGWAEFPHQTPKEHENYVRTLDRMFSHPNGNVVKRWMQYLTKCRENGLTPIPRPNKREYIEAYNLNERTFDYPLEQPFVLAAGKRAGILMHPAWLIAHSLNLDNDPIRRGKWIRERLLADTVPELPITVDARLPDEPEQTLRQRLQVTQQAECWRCHVKMNPLGMPFELYDDFGRHRNVEKLLAKGKSAPVDSSGVLIGTGHPEFDGDVSSSIDLVHRLAQSERVRQSFVRHAFRFWMGRNEMLSDSPTLIAADRAYVAEGGSFRALVISLLTSDSFLYRKPMGAEHE